VSRRPVAPSVRSASNSPPPVGLRSWLP